MLKDNTVADPALEADEATPSLPGGD